MIRTKIAKILSPSRFVLAAGAEQGIKEGMEFIIYELSDDIEDPETKESLGQLELHKGRVKVIHVQDKLATATTLSRKFYRPGIFESAGLGVFSSLSKGDWYEAPEQLPVEGATAVAVKQDLKVRVGDLARNLN
ncbi:MAG TPA: hypothetical protein VE988_26285 [Gemmataceae bacterium]|nr:hypothetical protein [Gemmataceae bacterium]